LLQEAEDVSSAEYRLIFDTGSYYALQKIDALYPRVEVTFQARDGESHFHIPLLLSPNGYTTYRGS
jgi:5-hydroxyisourate hydrolase